MAHVFISYTWQDGDFARRLRGELSAAGLDVWMDDPFHAGQDWRAAVDPAIRDAFALVAVMSHAARRSEFVTYEWACAWGAGVPVIPVLLEPLALHPRLDALDPFDFSDPRDQPFDLLLADVIDALRWVRDPAAVPDLVALYNRGDAAIQEAITDAIRHMDGSAVPGLMALLRGDEAIQQTATRMLTLIGPAAIPALKDALLRDQSSLRLVAAHVLGEIGSREVVPALVEALPNADPHLRRLLVHALGRLGDPRAIPTLIDCLDDRDVQTVAAAIETLGRLDVRDAVPALCRVIERPEPTIRLAAAQVLGRLGDPRAVAALVDALRYNDYQLQLAAVEALAQIGSDDAIPALTDLLASDSVALRRAAAESLGRIRAETAVPHLVALLHGAPEKAVRAAAENALARIDTTAARHALDEARAPEDTSHQPDAAEQPPSWLRLSLHSRSSDHGNLINADRFSDDPFAEDDDRPAPPDRQGEP